MQQQQQSLQKLTAISVFFMSISHPFAVEQQKQILHKLVFIMNLQLITMQCLSMEFDNATLASKI